MPQTYYPPPRTTDMLSNSESPFTAEAKSLVKEQLSRIQGELDSIDQMIQKLCARRTILDCEKTKLIHLVSPIRSVPPEILCEIFQFCANSWWDSFGAWDSESPAPCDGIKWDREERPLEDWAGWYSWRLWPTRVISQVCRDWRVAARSHSKLWSDIYTSPSGSSIAAEKMLEDQLKLSGDHPLHIRVTTDCPMRLSSRLALMHHRWAILYTETPEPLLALSRNSSVSLSLSSLVSLTIFLTYSGPNISLNLSAVDAPLLTDVSLWHEMEAVSIQLPWAQLRRLRICNYRGRIVFAILKSLHRVEDLDLDCIAPYHNIEEESSPDTTLLPFLRRLQISKIGFSHNTPANILSYLRLPVLRTLVWTRMDASDAYHLEDVLQRSSTDDNPTLLELHLRDPRDICEVMYEVSPIINLFETLKSRLKTFTINCSAPPEHDLTLLLDAVAVSLCEDSMPQMRAFMLQGVFLNPNSVECLACEAENSNLDVRLLDCTFELEETYWDGSVYSLVQFLSLNPSRMSRFELDIAGPDSKRLTYSPQSGIKIVEPCRSTIL